MKEYYKFTNFEKNQLIDILDEAAHISPYKKYNLFKESVQKEIDKDKVPMFFMDICIKIKNERKNGDRIHILKNCPIDSTLPNLNAENPIQDKYDMKCTFYGEAFLELFSILTEAPIFSYSSRNKGDFFTDVVKINRMCGKNSGFTDGDLVYHNDRTSHKVKADYITLLGLVCPCEELIYTNFIDRREIMSLLSETDKLILSKKIFATKVDDLTRESNVDWVLSEPHEIISGQSIFFQDTLTKPVDEENILAWKALVNLRDAITLSPKVRYKLSTGDLFVFPNLYGLHNREKIEINNSVEASKRWLLKTYSFDNKGIAERYLDFKITGKELIYLDKKIF